MSEAPHHDTIDIIKIDRNGGHYCYWVSRLTSDDLHSKADIAAVLAWYRAELEALRADAARLNWMDAELASHGAISFVAGRWSSTRERHVGQVEVASVSTKRLRGNTVRDALDAALAAREAP